MTREQGQKPVILAVDDASDTLGMLSAVLEGAGMTALVASDAESALSLLGHIVPDLILMDAIMPRMDGFEATRMLKARENFAHIPVVFMTGLAEPENVVKGFEAGGVDYITKPIVPAVMLARVRAHLATARLAQSARRALDMSGSTVMAASPEGEILWVTPEGLKLLDDAAEDWRNRLAPVLAGIIQDRSGNVALKETREGMIVASFLGESQAGEFLLKLKDANAPSDAAVLKKSFALTDREAEVLGWLSKGKSNRDIAVILDCSPRTVNKHLEQIYSKLQVENRTAAAMRAIHVLSTN
ncbi:MAG TPA: response regulator [Rhizomicrobium sp.]|nr:response regulator [Rhizomicrobium sp.]